MTDATGRSFFSYRRTRAGQARFAHRSAARCGDYYLVGCEQARRGPHRPSTPISSSDALQPIARIPTSRILNPVAHPSSHHELARKPDVAVVPGNVGS
jgi:hypothetical protein